MRMTLGLGLSGLGYLTYTLGGFGIVGLFLFGIWTLIFTSVAEGFMMIGAAVVGAWVLQLLAGICVAAGMAIIESIPADATHHH